MQLVSGEQLQSHNIYLHNVDLLKTSVFRDHLTMAILKTAARKAAALIEDQIELYSKP